MNDVWLGILDRSSVQSEGVVLSADAIAFFLRWGFVPTPFSIYKDVNRSFDRLAGVPPLELGADLGGIDFSRFKFRHGLGVVGREYQYDEFREFIKKAVIDTFPDKDSKLGLMLSGGKDSTLLAYALKDAGYNNVVALTYYSGSREDERLDASVVCNALGYVHEVIEANLESDFNTFISSAGQNFLPNADFAYVAYLRCAARFSELGVESIVDGMGNDVYVGHVPPKVETTLQCVSFGSLLGKSVWGRSLYGGRRYDLKYLAQSLCMHSVERMFSGVRFDLSELKHFGFPTDILWEYLSSLRLATLSDTVPDRRAIVRGLLFDESSACDKGRLAAEAVGLSVRFPFKNESFSDYYFSLQRSDKFDWKARKNKVAIRKYLDQTSRNYGIDLRYNSEKGSFRFDYHTFICGNREKILMLFNSVDVSDVRIARAVVWATKALSRVNKATSPKIYILFCFFTWFVGVSKKGAVKIV